MNRFHSYCLIPLAFALLSMGSAAALRPSFCLAQVGLPINLNRMAPEALVECQLSPLRSVRIVAPQINQVMDEIFSLAPRLTYVNNKSCAIKLSITCGQKQCDAPQLQLHKPDDCCPGKGSTSKGRRVENDELSYRLLPTTRLAMQLPHQRALIAYWNQVGNIVVVEQIKEEIVDRNYAMTNRYPDG